MCAEVFVITPQINRLNNALKKVKEKTSDVAKINKIKGKIKEAFNLFCKNDHLKDQFLPSELKEFVEKVIDGEFPKCFTKPQSEWNDGSYETMIKDAENAPYRFGI